MPLDSVAESVCRGYILEYPFREKGPLVWCLHAEAAAKHDSAPTLLFSDWLVRLTLQK